MIKLKSVTFEVPGVGRDLDVTLTIARRTVVICDAATGEKIAGAFVDESLFPEETYSLRPITFGEWDDVSGAMAAVCARFGITLPDGESE